MATKHMYCAIHVQYVPKHAGRTDASGARNLLSDDASDPPGQDEDGPWALGGWAHRGRYCKGRAADIFFWHSQATSLHPPTC
jgi:hypothetical protein